MKPIKIYSKSRDPSKSNACAIRLAKMGLPIAMTKKPDGIYYVWQEKA